MSSDESDAEPPKIKVRRLDDSRTSTSSGSPVIGLYTRAAMRRNFERYPTRSTESDGPIRYPCFRRRTVV